MNKICIAPSAINPTLVYDGSETARDPYRGNFIGLYFAEPSGVWVYYHVDGDWGETTSEAAAIHILQAVHHRDYPDENGDVSAAA